MIHYFKRFKKKWEIKSNFQLVVILIVFSVTGSVTVAIAKPILEFLGITKTTFEVLSCGVLLYWILRILIIFPLYQIIQLIIATIFFQFRFFWNFEKKLFSRLFGKKI